jgi:hypothetical protein
LSGLCCFVCLRHVSCLWRSLDFIDLSVFSTVYNWGTCVLNNINTTYFETVLNTGQTEYSCHYMCLSTLIESIC